MKYTHEQLISIAKITSKDMELINQCRRQHNRLGFGYQLCFVRLLNRFPSQYVFEVSEDLLNYVSAQLNIPYEAIQIYTQRRQTIDEHQQRIAEYLGLSRFSNDIIIKLKSFIFEEACRLEQTSALIAKSEQFLKENRILKPSDNTLKRLIGNQREAARQFIFEKIETLLSESHLKKLDMLLETKEQRFSEFHFLKQTPGRASPLAMWKLIDKKKQIETTGILQIDLSWLNNNFQRSLTYYGKQCSATRLRELKSPHRYAVLVCSLRQIYYDTVDQLVDMYEKLINRTYKHAQNDMDNYVRLQRRRIRQSLSSFSTIVDVIMDESVDDATLRQEFFQKIGKETLVIQAQEVNTWLTGKYSHVFKLVLNRFSYLRQFAPAFLKHIHLEYENEADTSLLKAIQILQELDETNKRKLPDDTPIDFIPKKLQSFIEINGKLNKPAWECALLTAVRDEVKSGNLAVKMSKRFGRIDDFFIPKEKWDQNKEAFFRRASLPSDPNEVEAYLKERLNSAYDQFLEDLSKNEYVKVHENGWSLSTDPAEKLDAKSEKRLERLKEWLYSYMRVIKLPELLIEVDNELNFTRHFMTTSQRDNPKVDEICTILATIIAHGCNIGAYTMAQLCKGISYYRIKQVTDWMLTEESQRGALAQLVNAISQLDVTQAWGQGRTSSSDGQRFTLKKKVLQQTYSARFNDFALEFYSFVADNYAPFYSMPIECTDRDAPYVLDGLLYNESDLPLEEHYTDTHGYTEINFAAFAMLGRRFSPRIRGLHKQRIYRIDKEKDYKVLNPLVARSDRSIHIDWISEQWDRIGHFYASLEYGHVTASTALKRLNGFRGKNHFYLANRELGRVFKTEHILQYMSDKTLRQKTRRGLLKGEQIHALARELNYGKRGRITQRDLHEQKNSCSCLTLLMMPFSFNAHNYGIAETILDSFIIHTSFKKRKPTFPNNHMIFYLALIIKFSKEAG